MNEIDVGELERRLENWGSWARSRPGGARAGRCASAEGAHVPLRDDDGTRLVQSAKEPVAAGDAEVIEAAVLKLRRSGDRRLMVMTYVERLADVSIAGCFNIPPRLVRPHQVRVMVALKYHLDHDVNLVLAARRNRKALHPADRSNMYESLTNEVTGA